MNTLKEFTNDIVMAIGAIVLVRIIVWSAVKSYFHARSDKSFISNFWFWK